MNHLSFYTMWMAGCMRVANLGNTSQGCIMGRSRLRQCDALGSVLLGNLGSCHPCGCYFDMYHLAKHYCRPCTPLHGNSIPWWLWPLSARQCTVPRSDTLTIIFLDNTAALRKKAPTSKLFLNSFFFIIIILLKQSIYFHMLFLILHMLLKHWPTTFLVLAGESVILHCDSRLVCILACCNLRVESM